MENILIINFSVFELHLNTEGHVFGALVLRILRMHRIRTNTQKFKIVLPGYFQVIIQVAIYFKHTILVQDTL